jgi:hypothetical protein
MLPVLVMTHRVLAVPDRDDAAVTAGRGSAGGHVAESAIGGKGVVTVPAASFAGTLATRIQLAPPRNPEFKGLVERNNGYFETSFLPGRTFASPAQFNTQLAGWLPKATGAWCVPPDAGPRRPWTLI